MESGCCTGFWHIFHFISKHMFSHARFHALILRYWKLSNLLQTLFYLKYFCRENCKMLLYRLWWTIFKVENYHDCICVAWVKIQKKIDISTNFWIWLIDTKHQNYHLIFSEIKLITAGPRSCIGPSCMYGTFSIPIYLFQYHAIWNILWLINIVSA